MKSAIIYSRVSTADQDNDRQIQELKAYAKYAKLNILKVFEEKITGAMKAKDRAEFSALMRFVEKQEVNTVLVWELSRLGRTMVDVINTIEDLSQRGINIFIKKENMNTLDSNGKKSIMTTMILSVLSGFAEMERETTRQRAISGIRASVAKGGVGTSQVKAYGYKKDDKKLVIHVDEADVVKLIFKKYLEGLGCLQIANHLNTLKVPTRFNKLYSGKEIPQKHGILKKGETYTWKDGTIYSILTNPIYKGERRHKGEVFPIEGIVDAETFDDAQRRLTSNYNKKGKHQTYENPLSDIIICGKCGRGYFMHKRHDNKDNAYKCISKRYGENCENPSVNIDKLLDALYKVCQPIIFNDEVEKNSEAIMTSMDNKQIEITNATSEIESLNKKLDGLIRMNLEGHLTMKKFSELKREIDNEIIVKDDRLVKLNSELKKMKSLLTKPKKIGSYNFKTFKDYLKDAVEHVKIFDVGHVNMELLREPFPVKSDKGILVEVKSLLNVVGEPVYYHFVLSRYSNSIAWLSVDNESKDYVSQIQAGKFELSTFFDLKEFEPLKYMRIKGFKKEGSMKNSTKLPSKSAKSAITKKKKFK